MNKENLEKIFHEDLGTSLFPLLANIYISEGEHVRARQVCDIGLLLNPNNNDGKFVLAKIEVMEDQSSKAEKLLKEIIQSDDLYINAMKMLIMVYQNHKRNQSAMVKTAQKILELLPGDEFASKTLKGSNAKSKNTKTQKRKVPILKKKSSTKIKKVKGTGDTMDPKMATLTFVDILIQQRQYQQASTILELVRNKHTVSANSIKIRMDKIINGLSEEE